MDFEQYKTAGKTNQHRHIRKGGPELYNMDAIKYDNTTGAEVSNRVVAGPLGSKYMRGYIDRDMNDTREVSCSNA
jgi:hypothetical protein